MAEQGAINLFGQQAANNEITPPEESIESTDRGMFDFMKKKKEEDEQKPPHEEEMMASDFDHKVHVVAPHDHEKAECKKEENADAEHDKKKHGSLLDKLKRSDSSSSSSSSDEEKDDEEKKRKRKEKKEKKEKGLKEKIKEKLPGHKDGEEDTNVPVEKCHDEEGHEADKNKKEQGFMDKVKDKMPDQHKKVEEQDVAPAFAPAHKVETPEAEPEKKGFLEKIKEKIPGFSPKNGEEEKNKDEKKESHV